MSQPSKLVELRERLRREYPDAHRHLAGNPSPSPASQESPAPAAAAGKTCSLPETLSLPRLRNRVTEITAASSSPVTGLLLHHLLEQVRTAGQGLALIDAADQFDPCSYSPDLCRNLFWARCRELDPALKAVDLFLRDGNLPLVLLDLVPAPSRTDRSRAGPPSSTWYRFRQLTEQTGTGLCVLSTRPRVPSAQFRFELEGDVSLDALEQSREELLPQLRLRVRRSPSFQSFPAEPSRRIA